MTLLWGFYVTLLNPGLRFKPVANQVHLIHLISSRYEGDEFGR